MFFVLFAAPLLVTGLRLVSNSIGLAKNYKEQKQAEEETAREEKVLDKRIILIERDIDTLMDSDSADELRGVFLGGLERARIHGVYEQVTGGRHVRQ